MLCGAPGLNLTFLNSVITADVIAVTKRGRRELREHDDRKYRPAPEEANKKKAKMTEGAVTSFLRNTQINDLQMFLYMLEDEGKKGTSEYVIFKTRLNSLLRERVYSYTYSDSFISGTSIDNNVSLISSDTDDNNSTNNIRSVISSIFTPIYNYTTGNVEESFESA